MISNEEQRLIDNMVKHVENIKQIKALELLDKGGQKIVLKGTHDEYGDVVLKIIEIYSEGSLNRALREIECSARLDDTRFAKIYEYNTIVYEKKNCIYVIEEYINGETLRKVLQDRKKLNLKDTLYIGKEILYALIQIHELNLVHRDLKPENIMVAKDRIVLLDFGIVRDLAENSLTSDLALFGPMTIGYAAPEQIKNEKGTICNRTDLFAWGILMTECVTGINPFKDECKTREEVLLKTLNYTPKKIELENEALSDIIHMCLDKAVHRRPKSCDYILKLI